MDFSKLKQSIEHSSCSGIPVSHILDNADADGFSEAEKSIIDSFEVIDHWLSWDPERLSKIFTSAIGRAQFELESKESKNAQAHMKLIGRLFIHRLNNPNLYIHANQDGISLASSEMIVIGDSHSLELANMILRWRNKNIRFISRPIRGIKMFHIGLGGYENYRDYFESRLLSVDSSSEILLSIGEIDCRPNEGIYLQYKLNPKNDLNAILNLTVRKYLDYIEGVLMERRIELNKVYLLGLPFPAYNLKPFLKAKVEQKQFLRFIVDANDCIKKLSISRGFKYVDILKSSKFNASNSDLRVDDFHLAPMFYKKFFEENNY